MLGNYHYFCVIIWEWLTKSFLSSSFYLLIDYALPSTSWWALLSRTFIINFPIISNIHCNNGFWGWEGIEGRDKAFQEWLRMRNNRKTTKNYKKTYTYFRFAASSQICWKSINQIPTCFCMIAKDALEAVAVGRKRRYNVSNMIYTPRPSFIYSYLIIGLQESC